MTALGDHTLYESRLRGRPLHLRCSIEPPEVDVAQPHPGSAISSSDLLLGGRGLAVRKTSQITLVGRDYVQNGPTVLSVVQRAQRRHRHSISPLTGGIWP